MGHRLDGEVREQFPYRETPDSGQNERVDPRTYALSLRFRLNLMIGLVMLTILGMGTLFVVHHARQSVAEEVQASVHLALQLIDAGIGPANASGRSPVDWITELSRLDHIRHLRLQIHRGEQGLLELPASSAPVEAGVPGWFAWAVTPEPLVVEKLLPQGDDPGLAIAIRAHPADEIAEAWSEAQGFLALMIALAVAVYALVHVTLGRAFRCVDGILQGLEGIENGDYARRLPEFPLPEFSRISRAFNHTASALERAGEENRKLTQQSLAIQEEERRYLARELHDELGQSLSAIKVMTASLRKTARDEHTLQATTASIQSICDHLFEVVRGMMQRLHPLMLDELGLRASLEHLIENWRQRYPGIALDFHCDDGIDEAIGSARIHVFRIVQESLTNVVKHACARHLRIHLHLPESVDSRPAGVRLEVVDDGIGFDSTRPLPGLGLRGIRERVASLGGEFELSARPGAGVSLRVQIPCGGEHETDYHPAGR
jgi:two-component system sensor histidine kinase UhpB